MKNLLPCLLVAVVAACASSPGLPEGVAMGEPLEELAIHPLAEVAASPANFYEQTILVEATATAVCQKAGCWLQIHDGDAEAMVRWHTGCGGQYEFPRDVAGKKVLVQGSYYPKSISEADAKHLEEEAGKPVTIARETHEFNATAILVVGG